MTPLKSSSATIGFLPEVMIVSRVMYSQATLLTPRWASFSSRNRRASEAGKRLIRSRSPIAYGISVALISGIVVPHWKLTLIAASIVPRATAGKFSAALASCSEP